MLRFGPSGRLFVGVGWRNQTGTPPALFPSIPSSILALDVWGDDYPADPDRDYEQANNNMFTGPTDPGEPINWSFYSPRRAFFVGAMRLMIADQRRSDGAIQYRSVDQVDVDIVGPFPRRG